MWIKGLCVVAFIVLLNSCRAENPKVTTDCGGVVEGVEKDGAYSFRGIPFAKPPLGELRWQPPVSVTDCLEGVFNVYGEACYQSNFSKLDEHFGSEDCLFLNVWTPTTDSNASLPVMVWIHGGFNEFLSGNWPGYSPSEKLAKETDIVYVGMNYRLHAFGFMALDLISQSAPNRTSGNYGLMDQIEALRWVQKKISYFGGDPNKVTVFGQSSGGTDIYALLASKMAKGLFHKAWMSSASPVLNKTTAEASKDNLLFLSHTRCNTLACLKSLPAENITRAIPWYTFPNWKMMDLMTLPHKGEATGALPVVDGYVLTGEPRKVWSEYRNDVPVMIGTTAQEIEFDPADTDMPYWTWDKYHEEVSAKLSTFSTSLAKAALLFYPAGQISPAYQFLTMISDIRLTCPTEIITSAASLNFRSPIYRYVATAWPSKPTTVLGFSFPATYAFHCIDVLAFFDTLRNTINPLSHSDLLFQENVRNTMLSFVKDGKPSACWQQFDQMTALLSQHITFVSAYKNRECQFWLSNDFFKYGWVN
ncbi:hypothetical protein ScPMuIL_012157 [Solemya velum]